MSVTCVQGRRGSRSCWCRRRERSVQWGWEECSWWCGSPSCPGCCGCTNSPPNTQQVSEIFFIESNNFENVVFYRSVHPDSSDLVIVGVATDFSSLLEVTHSESARIGVGDHSHETTAEQSLSYVDIRLVWRKKKIFEIRWLIIVVKWITILMDQVHCIGGVDAEETVPGVCPHCHTSANIFCLLLFFLIRSILQRCRKNEWDVFAVQWWSHLLLTRPDDCVFTVFRELSTVQSSAKVPQF